MLGDFYLHVSQDNFETANEKLIVNYIRHHHTFLNEYKKITVHNWSPDYYPIKYNHSSSPQANMETIGSFLQRQ